MGTPERLSPWGFRLPLTPDEMLTGECTSDLFGHQWRLTATVSQRGVRMITATCKVCRRGTAYIKHDVIRSRFGTDPGQVPVDRDNRCGHCSGAGCAECCNRCARCREYKPTDRHHFAPNALFDDSDLWPTADLCRECHQYWHSIVTPNMRRNPQPPPPSLRDEWDSYQQACARIAAHGYHAWNELAPCTRCRQDRVVVDAFRTKYHQPYEGRYAHLGASA